MSKWLKIQSELDDFLHVVPCTDWADVLPPHTLTFDCQCKPKWDDELQAIVIHQDPEKGGYDS